MGDGTLRGTDEGPKGEEDGPPGVPWWPAPRCEGRDWGVPTRGLLVGAEVWLPEGLRELRFAAGEVIVGLGDE
jgi:hypothetical protein